MTANALASALLPIAGRHFVSSGALFRLLSSFLLFWLGVMACTLPGLSDTPKYAWKLQVNCEPSDAQIYVLEYFNPKDPLDFGRSLEPEEQRTFDISFPGLRPPTLPVLSRGRIVGRSGRPFLIELNSTQSGLNVLILREHCEALPQTLHLFDPGSALTPPSQAMEFPSKGQVYTLEPRGLLDRLCLLASQFWWIGAIVAGALIVSVAVYREKAAGLRLEAQKIKDADQKEHKLTDMVATSDGTDPFIGSKLDEYRILQKLGQGGMAKVYRAVPDDSMDEKQAVAIKIMSAESSEDAEMLRRFEREKRVYETLHHPNIVKVLASGLLNRQGYMVMELVRGSTLKPYILPDGMKPNKVEKLLAPVFLALAFAHRKGVVHRDLKPDNIMVTDQGVVKVMDFGLARKEEYTQITGTGSILGTPAYIAPEQIQGIFDPASDQYALGILMFQMLTGRLPFEDDSIVALLMSHMSKPAPLVESIKPELSKVSAVVERMLAKKPEDRYRDLDAALKAFRAVC